MANIPIDAIFNQAIYAKSRINKFAYPGGNSIGVIDPGNIIGRIYSYVLYNGSVYWMIDDIFGSQTFFVKHDPINLNLPNKQAILNDIAAKAEAKKLEDKGVLQYNIDKYLPYIIGAGIAAIALPSVIAAVSTKKVSGMTKKKNKNGVLLLGAATVAAYFLMKKKRKAGTPIIKNIDEGFVNEMQSTSTGQTATPETSYNVTPVTIADSFGNLSEVPAIQQAATVTSGGAGGGGGYIDYLGPFKAVYEDQVQNMVAGTRKGNIGKFRTC